MTGIFRISRVSTNQPRVLPDGTYVTPDARERGSSPIPNGSYLAFEVVDQNGAPVVEGAVHPAVVLDLFTGGGDVPCEYDIRFPERAGLTREVTTRQVHWDHPVLGLDDDPEVAAAKRWALDPHEVDGWRGRARDLGNAHRRSSDGSYAVSFTRDLRPDGEPWEDPRETLPLALGRLQQALDALDAQRSPVAIDVRAALGVVEDTIDNMNWRS